MKWFERACQPGRVYVIAELGSNYKTHDQLFSAIYHAKSAGADAIKYQFFNREELFSNEFTLSDLPLAQLKEKCDSVGIDFLCTAFSPQGMLEVNKYVDAHKIASSEMAHIRMLDLAKAFAKPVMLSTGGQGLEDIKYARQYLGSPETIIMHCNLAYPAKFVDIGKLHSILDYFRCPWGFSDHTTSIDAIPFAMLNAGAYVYEKHYNPHSLNDTPDAPHSLNQEEFKAFVDVLRGHTPAYTEENEARLRHVRRLIATKDISAGETFEENINFGIFRSRKDDAHGSSPFAIAKVQGRKAKRDFFKGDGIFVGDCD